ncbi:MAG: hypothetical protein ACMXYG_04835 [Candidatus Woesearchaeota archaeon]
MQYRKNLDAILTELNPREDYSRIDVSIQNLSCNENIRGGLLNLGGHFVYGVVRSLSRGFVFGSVLGVGINYFSGNEWNHNLINYANVGVFLDIMQFVLRAPGRSKGLRKQKESIDRKLNFETDQLADDIKLEAINAKDKDKYDPLLRYITYHAMTSVTRDRDFSIDDLISGVNLDDAEIKIITEYASKVYNDFITFKEINNECTAKERKVYRVLEPLLSITGAFSFAYLSASIFKAFPISFVFAYVGVVIGSIISNPITKVISGTVGKRNYFNLENNYDVALNKLYDLHK